MMNSLSAPSSLLLLLLLAPGVGLAAQETPDAPTARQSAPQEELTPASSGLPGTEERAPLRLLEDSGTREDEASRSLRNRRIQEEARVGLLTSLGGGFAGALAGTGLCAAGVIGLRGGFFSCLDATIGGLVLGGGLGFALGVWWGGEAAGGDGKLLGALAGFGGGVVLGLLSMVINFPIGVLLSLPVALIGSIVGYELTQRAPAAPALASTPARFQPVLAFSQHSALVGLGGSF